MTNGNKLLILAEELEATARKIKAYVDSQTIDDFTGATSSVGGASGLVPAPTAGDVARFLSAGGDWLPLLLGNSSSTVNGALWLA